MIEINKINNKSIEIIKDGATIIPYNASFLAYTSDNIHITIWSAEYPHVRINVLPAELIINGQSGLSLKRSIVALNQFVGIKSSEQEEPSASGEIPTLQEILSKGNIATKNIILDDVTPDKRIVFYANDAVTGSRIAFEEYNDETKTWEPLRIMDAAGLTLNSFTYDEDRETEIISKNIFGFSPAETEDDHDVNGILLKNHSHTETVDDPSYHTYDTIKKLTISGDTIKYDESIEGTQYGASADIRSAFNISPYSFILSNVDYNNNYGFNFLVDPAGIQSSGPKGMRLEWWQEQKAYAYQMYNGSIRTLYIDPDEGVNNVLEMKLPRDSSDEQAGFYQNEKPLLSADPNQVISPEDAAIMRQKLGL